MFYREAGQFKTSYKADQAIFTIPQDKVFIGLLLVIAFGVVPFLINDYWANAILIHVLVYALAGLGLNILTGYCGQVSLGTGGFMAVGAYASYKLTTSFPELNFIVAILLSGGVTVPSGVAPRELSRPIPERSGDVWGTRMACRGSTKAPTE